MFSVPAYLNSTSELPRALTADQVHRRLGARAALGAREEVLQADTRAHDQRGGDDLSSWTQ